jgi:hypothetical protein
MSRFEASVLDEKSQPGVRLRLTCIQQDQLKKKNSDFLK